MRSTRRLTMAQALIQYLHAQSVERDRRVISFFGPVLGIFGHGNVGGIGEALEARQKVVRFVTVRNEQAMVHAAAAFAWKHRRMRALACTTSIGPGATNLVTGPLARPSTACRFSFFPVTYLPVGGSARCSSNWRAQSHRESRSTTRCVR